MPFVTYKAAVAADEGQSQSRMPVSEIEGVHGHLDLSARLPWLVACLLRVSSKDSFGWIKPCDKSEVEIAAGGNAIVASLGFIGQTQRPKGPELISSMT